MKNYLLSLFLAIMSFVCSLAQDFAQLKQNLDWQVHHLKMPYIGLTSSK